jgi:hypothetical protein
MGAARSQSNHDHLRDKRKGGLSGGWLQNDVTKQLMLQSHRCRRGTASDMTASTQAGRTQTGRALASPVRAPEMARDGGQHQGEGIARGCDRQPSNRHTGNIRLRSARVRQPRRRCNVEIDHQRDYRHRLVLQLQNSKAAHLQKTSKGRRRPRNQPAMNSLDLHAIVGHQTRKGQPAAGRRLEQVEHEPRLARA